MSKLTRGEAIENIRCMMMLHTFTLSDEAVIDIHDRMKKLCDDTDNDMKKRMKDSGYVEK